LFCYVPSSCLSFIVASLPDYSETRVQNPRPSSLRRSDDGAYLRRVRDRYYLPNRTLGYLGIPEENAEVHVCNLHGTCHPHRTCQSRQVPTRYSPRYRIINLISGPNESLQMNAPPSPCDPFSQFSALGYSTVCLEWTHFLCPNQGQFGVCREEIHHPLFLDAGRNDSLCSEQGDNRTELNTARPKTGHITNTYHHYLTFFRLRKLCFRPKVHSSNQ
jgi:hypothetical protein